MELVASADEYREICFKTEQEAKVSRKELPISVWQFILEMFHMCYLTNFQQ
jgi:hypothetical protein